MLYQTLRSLSDNKTVAERDGAVPCELAVLRIPKADTLRATIAFRGAPWRR